MSRVEVIGDATLHLGDCREIVPALVVGAVVTDPPYGISHEHKTLGGIVGDDAPFDPAFLLAVGKQHVIWGANHFASRLPDATRWLMWLKHDPGLFGTRGHAPFDLAWTDLGGAGRAMRHIWDASIREGEWFGKPNCHPHQKPAELMAWCVSMTEGVVLDAFMGSGSTGVGATWQGRAFIGIEIEPRYFDIACERIEAARKQPRLFTEPAPPPTQGALGL